MMERAIRVRLDINVLVADLPGTIKGRKGTASRYLVDAVRNGECDAGPVQLIAPVPLIENWASVLMRRFNYDKDAAEETAWLLQDYALEGSSKRTRRTTLVAPGRARLAGSREWAARCRGRGAPRLTRPATAVIGSSHVWF